MIRKFIFHVNVLYILGESNECLIVLVSKSANVVSKYTAFVGVDRETRVRRAIVSIFILELVLVLHKRGI